MARDRPVTDDELETAAEAIRDQREAIRQDLEAAGVDVTDWTPTKPDAEPEPDRDAADSD